MTIILGLASVLAVVLSGYLALGATRLRERRSGTGSLPLLVLASPVLGLGFGGMLLHYLAGRTCFLGLPPWDDAVGYALPLGMSLFGLGTVALGIARVALVERTQGRGTPAGPELRAAAGRLAMRLDVPAPRVLVRPGERPLAFTCGLGRPVVVLSSWMVARLDPAELEAVLAHELAHVARGDYPLAWLATALRDAFVYLPTSRAAYRELQRERELACDDLAVRATRRPLALASALAKVWQEALVVRPAPATSLHLAGPDGDLERPASAASSSASHRRAMPWSSDRDDT